MSIALLGAFLIAAPVKADYSQVVEWLGYDSTQYELVNLITLNKDGSWDASDAAWSVEYLGEQSSSGTTYQNYGFNCDGTGTGYETMVFAMTGAAYGSPILTMMQYNAIMDGVRVNLGRDDWYSMRWVDNQAGAAGIIGRAVLSPNGTLNPGAILNGASQIRLYALDFFMDFGSFGEIALGFSDGLPAGFKFQIFAVKAMSNEIPEPATLAIVGLGLAGLGLARRRRK